ncbi:conserved hypothetical protein [delta proteobacterium NaphS2]|nr:conserved hypothetical protein [delta proteobacterium NaphS2]
MERQGKFLIVHTETDEPVQWHLRTALGKSDILRILWITFLQMGPVILMLLRGLFSFSKKKEPPKY